MWHLHNNLASNTDNSDNCERKREREREREKMKEI